MNVIALALLAWMLQSCTAKKGKPPEVDDNVRKHFKIPAGTKPFKLSCPIKDADPDDGIMVRWSKDEEEINSSEWSSSPYRLINGDIDLKIRNPQISDSGHYSCLLVNGFGHRKVEFTLQVYNASARRENPAETISLSDHVSSPIWHDRNAIDFAMKRPLRLSRGKRLELRCPASGNPLPKIFWSKDGNRISLELTSPTSAKFTMDNVDVEDSGVYTCRLENTLGSLEADFRVLVSPLDDDDSDSDDPNSDTDVDLFNTNNRDVDFSSRTEQIGGKTIAVALATNGLPQPTIDQPYNTTVRAGHTAQFQCKVQWRKEAPTMRWLRKIDNVAMVKTTTPNATILHIHNMHLLVLDQQHGEAQPSEPIGGSGSEDSLATYVNKLLIQNVQRSDAGQYFCVVTNSAGQFVFRSAYLNVAEGGRFFPFATSINVIIALIVAVVLTLVTLAVIWLCYNSSAESSSSKSLALSAPHQFSSTSSASSSATSTGVDKCAKSLSGEFMMGHVENADAATALFAHPDAMKHALFGEVLPPDELSAHPPPPPPPPPQIPLPQAPPLIAPNNTPASVITQEVQQQLLIQHYQQQIYQQQQQQQQQRLFDGAFTHRSQTHLHNGVHSPLLGGEPTPVHRGRHLPGHVANNGGPSIGELIYPSTMTLDRHYTNQRANTFGYQQHALHRTRGDDEMSRLSRHIYEILTENTPIHSQSPTSVRKHFVQQQQQQPRQQINDNNNNCAHREFQQPIESTCQPYSLPPPPGQRVPTPDARASCESAGSENANATNWNSATAYGRAAQAIEKQHLILQQQRAALHAQQRFNAATSSS